MAWERERDREEERGGKKEKEEEEEEGNRLGSKSSFSLKVL